MHVCLEDLENRKNLSLEILEGEIRPTFLLLSSALIARPQSSCARVLYAGEKDEKREAYRAERNRRFIQNSPMTEPRVLQGHILWLQMYGPDKLSVLAAREATSRNARAGNESKLRKKFLSWNSSRLKNG